MVDISVGIFGRGTRSMRPGEQSPQGRRQTEERIARDERRAQGIKDPGEKELTQEEIDRAQRRLQGREIPSDISTGIVDVGGQRQAVQVISGPTAIRIREERQRQVSEARAIEQTRIREQARGQFYTPAPKEDLQRAQQFYTPAPSQDLAKQERGRKEFATGMGLVSAEREPTLADVDRPFKPSGIPTGRVSPKGEEVGFISRVTPQVPFTSPFAEPLIGFLERGKEKTRERFLPEQVSREREFETKLAGFESRTKAFEKKAKESELMTPIDVVGISTPKGYLGISPSLEKEQKALGIERQQLIKEQESLRADKPSVAVKESLIAFPFETAKFYASPVKSTIETAGSLAILPKEFKERPRSTIAGLAVTTGLAIATGKVISKTPRVTQGISQRISPAKVKSVIDIKEVARIQDKITTSVSEVRAGSRIEQGILFKAKRDLYTGGRVETTPKGIYRFEFGTLEKGKAGKPIITEGFGISKQITSRNIISAEVGKVTGKKPQFYGTASESLIVQKTPRQEFSLSIGETRIKGFEGKRISQRGITRYTKLPEEYLETGVDLGLKLQKKSQKLPVKAIEDVVSNVALQRFKAIESTKALGIGKSLRQKITPSLARPEIKSSLVIPKQKEAKLEKEIMPQKMISVPQYQQKTMARPIFSSQVVPQQVNNFRQISAITQISAPTQVVTPRIIETPIITEDIIQQQKIVQVPETMITSQPTSFAPRDFGGFFFPPFFPLPKLQEEIRYKPDLTSRRGFAYTPSVIGIEEFFVTGRKARGKAPKGIVSGLDIRPVFSGSSPRKPQQIIVKLDRSFMQSKKRRRK